MIKQIANYYGFDCQSRQLVEELADVEVMLEQIKYLMSCNAEVDDIKKKKINRQLKRIKKEKLEKTGIK